MADISAAFQTMFLVLSLLVLFILAGVATFFVVRRQGRMRGE